MKAPDKIYIAETPNKLIEIWSDEPIESKPYITEHEYIRKDALLKWAKRLKERWEEPPVSRHSPGCVFMLERLIDKLNLM